MDPPCMRLLRWCLLWLMQPEPQFYFHRPLSTVFKAFFDQSFVLDGFLEPAVRPPLDYKAEEASMRHYMWYEVASKFPWVAAMRFVLPGTAVKEYR